MTSGLIYILPCTLFQKHPGLFLKKIENVLERYQKFSKNHKSTENIWYFKAHVNNVSTYTSQISLTDLDIASKILLQKFMMYHVLK